MTSEELLAEATALRNFVETASISGGKLHFRYYLDANWQLLAEHGYHRLGDAAKLVDIEMGLYRLLLAELLEDEARNKM